MAPATLPSHETLSQSHPELSGRPTLLFHYFTAISARPYTVSHQSSGRPSALARCPYM